MSGVNSLINSAEPDCLCVLMNEYETELRVNVCQALLERTGYTLDVTTGQRKYGGPPPEEVFSGPQPGIGTEVYCPTLTVLCVPAPSD